MIKNKLVLVGAAVAATVVVGSMLGPTNIEPDHKFSWSENLGWMNWRDADANSSGVVVSATALSGLVWFENGGWMNVGNGGSQYANTDGTDFGVNVIPGGNLHGYAWRENGGWVNFGWAAFSGDPDRARVDVATGRLRGLVWSENDGWINLDDETHYVGVENLCPPTSRPVAETLPLPGSPESTKNRFLSISTGLGDEGQNVGIRIRFALLPPPYDLWNGSTLWVGEPKPVSESGANVAHTDPFPDFNAARLQCTPYYTDFSALGVVHVFHEGIVPEGVYSIDVIDEACDRAVEPNYSHPIEMTTAYWGDTLSNLASTPPGPPGGPPVEIDDVLGILGAFSNAPGAIFKARADLEPACLDLTINVTDVLSSIAGFSGLSYPFLPTAGDPCDSTCVSPLP